MKRQWDKPNNKQLKRKSGGGWRPKEQKVGTSKAAERARARREARLAELRFTNGIES